MANKDITSSHFSCKHCQIIKPRKRFRFYIKCGVRYRDLRCKDCINELARTRQRGLPKPGRMMKRKFRPRFDFILGYEVKRCSICETEKPLDDFVFAKQRGTLRRIGFCSPCRLTYKRAWRRGQPAKVTPITHKQCGYCGESKTLEEFPITYLKKIGPRRRSVCGACSRQKYPEQWKLKTPEEQRDIQSRLRANTHRYIERNRDKAYECRRRYAQNNPQKRAETQNRRRARKLHATVENVDRLAIIARDGGICYLCGARPQGSDLTLDHVMPLSRGGAHSAANLKVACSRCNLRKHNKLLSELSGLFILLPVPLLTVV